MFKIVLIVLSATGNPIDMPGGKLLHQGDIIFESISALPDEKTCWLVWDKIKSEIDAQLQKHNVSIRYLPSCEEAF